MGTHRTWDESQSPQWRYLQEKESVGRKNRRKTAARELREQQEISLTPNNKNTNDKWQDINSELKKEKIKHDRKRVTRLSSKSEEQE
jgi:hypothetical protein